MTTAQIHKVVYLHGLVKGTVIHRVKVDGRTVGLDELRYFDGSKSQSGRIKSIYQSVINGTL